jgi:hypothetical protein
LEIFNKGYKFTMVNIVSQVIKEYVEKIRPRVEPCGTPDVA